MIIDKLRNKSILITGGTGLIGSNIVNILLEMNDSLHANISIVLLVRNLEKAKKLFREMDKDNSIIYYDGTLKQFPKINEAVDYVIHAANPTSSSYFIGNPVETIETTVLGTNNILKLAQEKAVEGLVFLSTMEIYGEPERGHKVTEDETGSFDSTYVRNSYPLSKLVCENLCCSYYKEYGVPAKIARLTQTFGEGVDYNDGRVFAEFARSVIEGRNIILKTKGETERCYVSVKDAVEAILLILVKGQAGEAYTVANEETYCSIYEMAKLVADSYGIEVEIKEQDVMAQGYANTLFMNLDTSKLQALGWSPKENLKIMFEKMISSMRG